MNICAPIGGFGNHVRNLLLLDPFFSITIEHNFWNREKYLSVMGPDWPTYEEYFNYDFGNCSDEIKSEILNMHFRLPERVVLESSDQKLNFFKSKVYPESRTWHNWLVIEWKYREDFDNLICFRHQFTELTAQQQAKKTLILTVNPELAYRSYLKFNSNLNNRLESEFKKSVVLTNNQNQMPTEFSKHYIKTMQADDIYKLTLDKNFYHELIEWFGLENLYDDANHIHGLWYEGHRRSEREFVNDIQKLYKT